MVLEKYLILNSNPNFKNPRKSNINSMKDGNEKVSSKNPYTSKKLTAQGKFKKAIFKLKVIEALATEKYHSCNELPVKDIEDGT
jgi:hypothetical protein